jgi:hypothetical protein
VNLILNYFSQIGNLSESLNMMLRGEELPVATSENASSSVIDATNPGNSFGIFCDLSMLCNSDFGLLFSM